MKTLGLYDFLRHMKRNIYIALLVATMCLIITSMYSIYDYQSGKYAPFKSLESKADYYLGALDTESGQFDISEIEGIDEIYEVYASGITGPMGYISTYGYGEWVWKNWEGRLKSGSWFKNVDTTENTLEIVLGGNTEGYHIGDTFVYETDSGEITCKIIGLLQENTEILLRADSFNRYQMEYASGYEVPGISSESGMFAIVQKEAVDELELDMDGCSAWKILSYDDNMLQTEKDKLSTYIGNSTWGMGYKYEQFIEKSDEIFDEKITLYIPLIILGVVLILIALLSVSFINAKKGARYYSVYRLIGASKRQCYGIALGNVIGTIVTSGIFYIIGDLLIQVYSKRQNMVYNISAESRFLAVILYMVFALYMYFCMYYAMRKKSSLDLLRSRK